MKPIYPLLLIRDIDVQDTFHLENIWHHTLYKFVHNLQLNMVTWSYYVIAIINI